MPGRDVDARSFLPLTPLVFQVLLALADRPLHGYGIILEVDERTDGLIRLRTGTLYVLLQRLAVQRLIEPVSPDEVDDVLARGRVRASVTHDDRRRYYAITALGRQVLQAEARRLEAAVGEARRKRVLRKA